MGVYLHTLLIFACNGGVHATFLASALNLLTSGIKRTLFPPIYMEV